MEYSRSGFIARQAGKKLRKLVIRVHNVEKDYYDNRIIMKRSISNYLRLLFKRKLTTRQERICLSCADCLICLTAEDAKRLKELYTAETAGKKVAVIPVALEHPQELKINQPLFFDGERQNLYLLITGSLWFGPNAEGAIWFIKKVLSRLITENYWVSNNFKLIVAGSRPDREIKALAIGQKHIELVDSPKAMKPYFEKALIYLAPIFSGAGMKVKVAEALSYGLPVIGTSHALTGYKITDRESGYRADCADDFIIALEHYAGLSVEGKNLMKKKAYQLFIDEHSIEISKKSFQKIIRDLVQR
jgi:glycosyltransferase involved in cell wall biosynthesis